MKFHYRRMALTGEPNERLRPALPVLIRGGSRTLKYTLLIDTGADETMLPMQIADRLGVKFEEGEAPFRGVGSEMQYGRRGDVTISFGGGRFSFTCRALFHPELRVPLLGHTGFFERYRVTVNAGDGLFHIADPRRFNA